MNDFFPESVDGLPNLCGSEPLIAAATAGRRPVFLPDSDVDFSRVRSAFAVALHMHQPLIPAGPAAAEVRPVTRAAGVVSNLRHMLDHPEMPDAHNAAAFLRCYRRMGEFIPQLLAEGKSPRVMLDYSGCLLHGLRQMGAGDVIDALKPLAQDPAYRKCVEWLGTAWGHAVAPSTPPAGLPPARAGVAAPLRRGLRAGGAGPGAGVLAAGDGPAQPPRRLLRIRPHAQGVRLPAGCWCRSTRSSASRTAAPSARPTSRTGWSPATPRARPPASWRSSRRRAATPSWWARCSRTTRPRACPGWTLAGKSVPQLVTQIGDGENGGVMMNEFPPKFMQVIREASGSDTPAMNATEYLEHLAAAGVVEADLPSAAAGAASTGSGDRFEDNAGAGRLESAIEQLRREGGGFHVEGGSWTGDRSWVRGYEAVLGPMEAASRSFAEAVARGSGSTGDAGYRAALFHLLSAQTSCFRYWGARHVGRLRP